MNARSTYARFEQGVARALGSGWHHAILAGDHHVDFASEDRRQVVELKLSLRESPRDVATAATRLALICRQTNASRGVLAWWTSTLPVAAMRRAWEALTSVLAPDVAERLQLAMASPDAELIVPDAEPGRQLVKAMRIAAAELNSDATARPDRTYDVLKILLLRWLRDDPPIAVGELQAQSGLSHPTVALRIDELGPAIARTSNRSVSLREFPVAPWTELVARSPRARRTAHFEDRSGRARDLSATLARLRRQAPPHVAISGVTAARHWQPDFDLDGTPRLDVVVHAPDGAVDVGFVARLDPALVAVRNTAATTLAVHMVTRAESLFTDDRGPGMPWADPVEVLLDLHQLRLVQQADEFVRHWRRRR